ncbi:MAG: CcmD family protein [Candidatus Zixiibacteriota bacterium]|nr:MAG: CcmD family protein [candidate division Zixibacteria bacterium]
MDDNYIAMIVTLVIWIGLFLFLIRLDKRVKNIEEKNR